VQHFRFNRPATRFTFCVVAVIVLSCSAIVAAKFDVGGDNHTSWRDYGGAPDSSQYSALRQISRANVKNLKIAWTYRTGDNKKYYFNPLMVDGLLYVLAKNNSVVALDAATGKEIWVHPTDPDTTLMTTRGLNYWESADRSDRRLFYANNNVLRALDARTGQLIKAFGINGGVDLREDLGRDAKTIAVVQSLAPGRVFENCLILGSATGQAWGSAPGDIRAYDVRTGRLAWSFHTIPHPGEFGYDTWPKDAWKNTGGANAWGELTLDTQRGIVYVPTASPKYNFYGGERIGADLFADCLLALDARTGKRLWHFQMVHHDIWDYDDNTAPKLLTVKHDGKTVDIVAEASKQGFVYVFNRVTGEPIWPIEERPVPQTDVPGEQTWPTQPFPVKPPPFARQKFTADDLSPYISDPLERARVRDEVFSARNLGLYTPPGQVNTIQMPGNVGGANWGSAAVDPANGSMFVVSKDFPTMLKMERDVVRKAPLTGTPEQQGHVLYNENCQACHGAARQGHPPAIPSLVDITLRQNLEQIANTVKRGVGPMPGFTQLSDKDLQALIAYLSNPAAGAGAVAPPPEAATAASAGPIRYHSGFGYMITSDGLSAIRPPWSTLTAYDMNQGTIKWQIPLGDFPPLAAKGITGTGSHFPRVGPVVTGGGLIFTGTRDRKVRAFDEETGEVVWEATLDSALEGMPAVYELGGREYIVFCAAARDGTVTFEKPGQFAKAEPAGAYVAFALDQKRLLP
jgi:quinoprotein glucose dehydrogenase